MRPSLLATLVAGLTGLLAACGGDDLELGFDADIGGTAAQVCERVDREFDRLQAGELAAFSEAVELTRVLLEITEAADAALAELKPPRSKRQPYQRYLQARERLAIQLRKGLAAAEAGDGEAYRRAQRKARRSIERRRTAARRAGLGDCARVSG